VNLLPYLTDTPAGQTERRRVVQIRGKTLGLVIALSLVVVAAIGAGIWLVARESETTAMDRCGYSTYEFAVEEGDGGLEVSYELQSVSPDETWTVEVRRGDARVFEGERLTDGDGELDVDVLVPARGDDSFSVTATPEAAGEPCTAELTHG
jgi:hypothetical protein